MGLNRRLSGGKIGPFNKDNTLFPANSSPNSNTTNDKTSIYSFFRYWDIDKSDTATGTFAGVLKFQAYEPANKTTEIGLGITYKF